MTIAKNIADGIKVASLLGTDEQKKHFMQVIVSLCYCDEEFGRKLFYELEKLVISKAPFQRFMFRIFRATNAIDPTKELK